MEKAMKQARVPFKRMVFVCTHQREGEAACANAGHGENRGDLLVELLREELKKRGLKGKIRIAKSGCMDVCAAGPNLMIFDEKGDYTWLSGVTRENIPALADQYLKI
jgi:(2Fe-2S) ferredoxin